MYGCHATLECGKYHPGFSHLPTIPLVVGHHSQGSLWEQTGLLHCYRRLQCRDRLHHPDTPYSDSMEASDAEDEQNSSDFCFQHWAPVRLMSGSLLDTSTTLLTAARKVSVLKANRRCVTTVSA